MLHGWFCNSIEYQNGQPLLGRAPAEAHGPHLKQISRRQVTVPDLDGTRVIVLDTPSLTLTVSQFEKLAGFDAEFLAGANLTIADRAQAFLASSSDFGAAGISVTDAILTLSVAQFESLAELGAVYVGAVTVSDRAEKLLASDADFEAVKVVVTDHMVSLSVQNYKNLIELGAEFDGVVTIVDLRQNIQSADVSMTGVRVVILDAVITLSVLDYQTLTLLNPEIVQASIAFTDTATAYLDYLATGGAAKTALLSAVSVTVSGAAATLSVRQFEALQEVKVKYAVAVTVADTAEKIIESIADFEGVAVRVTDANVTLTVEQFEVLTGLSATYTGVVTVQDTAANLLKSNADYAAPIVIITDRPDLVLDVAGFERFKALDSFFLGTIEVQDTAENILDSDVLFTVKAANNTSVLVPIVVLGESVTVNVDDFEALQSLKVTYKGTVTVKDTAANVLASSANFDGAERVNDFETVAFRL
jgi:hypothetical protein